MISTFVISVKEKKFRFASCHHDDPLRDNTVANSVYYLKFSTEKNGGLTIRGWPIILFLDKRFKQTNRIPMEKGMISTFVITDCMEKKKCRICFHDEAILPKKYQLGLTLFREKNVKPNWHFSLYDLVCKKGIKPSWHVHGLLFGIITQPKVVPA